MKNRNLQFDAEGRLRHFIDIEGLSRSVLTEILDIAENFATVGTQQVKKVPLLRGKTIVNLFFEPSTRTRTTFELAAKRLSADVQNINISTSSTSKGESLLDMLRNLEAMQCDISSRLSPLLVEEVLMLIFCTSAESRLAASSKVVRVRVLGSKNRLTMVLPRSSGTFFTCWVPTVAKFSAMSRISVKIERDKPSMSIK